MSYQVGVDLGTTYSAAAVCRSGVPAPEPVPLGEHSSVVASAVYAGGDGSFLLGEAAERRALSDPDRVVREFKRRIGDATPVLVGREPVPAEVLAARFIARLLADIARREGGPASRVAITHPAGWGAHKVGALAEALAGHGVGPLAMLSEPQAAAVGYANAERVEPGAVVAVYDLGGGTFDAAVVRKSGDGSFELLGRPEGIERLGGVDFDDVVFEHVRQALGPAWTGLDPTDPAVLAAVARLRRECTAAKEVLSVDTEVEIPVMLPGQHTKVRLGRAEFEEMIRPAIEDTVAALRRALDSARVAPADLTALLLVGGSSRIPLVTQLVSAGLGRPTSVDVDPKGVIAAGAALVARGPLTRPEPATVAALVPGVVPAEVAERPAEVSDTGTALAPVVSRPPKNAQPFAAGLPAPGRNSRRTVVLAVAASVLTAALVGGALALDRVRQPDTADASTPTPTATAEQPPITQETVVMTVPPPPADRTVAPPVTSRPPATTTVAPDVTDAPPDVTDAPPDVTDAPPDVTDAPPDVPEDPVDDPGVPDGDDPGAEGEPDGGGEVVDPLAGPADGG